MRSISLCEKFSHSGKINHYALEKVPVVSFYHDPMEEWKKRLKRAVSVLFFIAA